MTNYDNAVAESVIGRHKTECVRHDGPWHGLDDLELATLSWVHWFNHHRLHSMLGHVSPVEYMLPHTAKWRILGVALRAATRGLGPRPTAEQYAITTSSRSPCSSTANF